MTVKIFGASWYQNDFFFVYLKAKEIFGALIHCYFLLVKPLGYTNNITFLVHLFNKKYFFHIFRQALQEFHCFFYIFWDILAYEPRFLPRIVINLHKIMVRRDQTTCSYLEKHSRTNLELKQRTHGT